MKKNTDGEIKWLMYGENIISQHSKNKSSGMQV